jgi:LacI family transcriptional regulator
MTLGALRAIYEKPLTIPRDLALAAFDNLDWMPNAPHILYAEQPTYELGRMAARLLLERLKSPERAAQKVVLETELHLDDTTSPKSLTHSQSATVSQGP